MPRPTDESRAAAKDRIADLKKIRDKAHEKAEQDKADADKAMWKEIAAELDAETLLQTDAADATGFSRDHILKRTKPFRTKK